MLDIIIPLAGKSAWGDNNELRYFLRSLEKNLRMDFRVKLYARALPRWIKNVEYEIVPKYYPDRARAFFNVDKGGKKHYEHYFDVLHKLDVMSRDETRDDLVLYCYDDLLLLKEVEQMQPLERVVAMMHYADGKEVYDANLTKWARTVNTAFAILRKLDRPIWDYETHLPRLITRTRLRKMFESFPVEEQAIPYAPMTLYYNLYYEKPQEKVHKTNQIKAGFYGSRDRSLVDFADYPANSIDDIKKAKKGKLWLNYNNKGLADYTKLKEFIEKTHPQKSKFER